MELWQLQQMQGLPLEIKIEKSKLRIQEWYEHYEGQVYVSFSGGKDSTVLLHIVRELYPDVPAVFVDTGLEYPEIRAFVKSIDNVIWLKPKMPFTQVIEKYGYPAISKDVSLRIHYAKQGKQWAINAMDGLEIDGTVRENSFKARYKKYKYLLDAPFNISHKCCELLKERPMSEYETEKQLKPIIGIMADESQRRTQSYLKLGCNSFDKKQSQRSTPIAFWKEKDIWEYIRLYKIPYSKIYDMGYKRTGCMFCAFGVNLEHEPNRFQKMALTHPKQYDYCMNKLGLKEVLDFIQVPYLPNVRTFKDDKNHKYQQYKIEF